MPKCGECSYADALRLLRQELDAPAKALTERETLDEPEIVLATGFDRPYDPDCSCSGARRGGLPQRDPLIHRRYLYMPQLATGAVFLVLSAFLASTVEMVEALTIVLAVGVSRQWRSTLIGVGAALVALAAVVAALGPA